MRYFLVIGLSLLCTRIDCQNFTHQLENLGCTTLLNLLTQTNVLSQLESEGNVTLFAPNDKAMEAVELPDDVENLLKYHAVAQRIKSNDIKDEHVVQSMDGIKPIRFNIYNGTSKTAQGAPIDLQNVDVPVENGLIHVLTAVISPPSFTIYEWIENNPTFTQLKAAIDKAALMEIFNNETAAFTLFAPNDEAFDKVPDGDLDDLNNETLKAVLLYHGIGGTHFSIDINDEDEFESLAGDGIVIVAEGSKKYINETDYAEVIELDKSVTNGVIHVINRVLKMDVVNGSTTLSIQTSIIFSLLTLLIATLQF